MMSSFPLVSFLITLLLAAAVCTNGNEQVKDTAGNPVLVGEQYFIKTESNNGGGLYPLIPSLPHPWCPNGFILVLQSQPGLPVSFQYPGFTIGTTVNTSVHVNIEFIIRPTVCSLQFPPLWTVDYESSFIFIGGWPSPTNQFKIEKAGEGAGENTYKFTSLTGTVGITPGILGVHLGVTNDDARTLLVKFDKVDAHDATPSTSSVDKLGRRMFPFY